MISVWIGFGFKNAVEADGGQMNGVDWFSDIVNYGLLIFIILFPIIVAEFTIFRSFSMYKHANKEAKYRYQKFIEDSRQLAEERGQLQTSLTDSSATQNR